MIPLDRLRAVKHIVTHENCADGIASAMILKNVLPAAKVSFLQYDTLAHIGLEPEEGMLFCDFSPHKDSVAIFKARGAIVLDHHKTQKEVVAKFGELGVFADEKEAPGVCGATLAFREVWAPLTMARLEASLRQEEPPPVQGGFLAMRDFATLAGIRDTWQKTDPQWRQACEQAEALVFWPVDELLGLSPANWPSKLSLGPVLFDRKLRGAQKCLEHGLAFVTGKGRKVLAFEGLRQSSDAAEMAGDDYDFVAGFGFNAEEHQFPSVIYSTRSRKGFDCSAFCLAHGGGGHTAAAGCKVTLGASDLQPYELLRRLLARYEEVEEHWLKVVGERKKDPTFEPVAAYNALLAGLDSQTG